MHSSDSFRITCGTGATFSGSGVAGDDVPYVVVQARLDNGPLTITWVGPDDPEIVGAVAVSSSEVADGVARPEFGPARS
ncbi:hypothetical protein [Gordonia sihwensis]|uniref:hypothetical protein n=1 Tax=Gordonia sihwensis TaxID=173559 RepID=UPI003D98D30A